MTAHAVESNVRAEPDRFAGVSDYLAWDHARLEALIAETARLVDLGSCGAARAVYESFEGGLRRHIRLEESVLFPVFETRAGLGSGPTAAMRRQHREIERSLELIREALDADDADQLRDALAFFESVAAGHHSKEENFLYPAIERILSAPEQRALMGLLQRP